MTLDDSEESRFSRSGMSCVFGKCSEEIKSKVPEDVKNQMIALATINHQTVSEYLRDLCIGHVYGHTAMVRARVGKGMSEKGPE